MALSDFQVLDPKGDGAGVPSSKYQTKAGNTAILPGEFVVQGTGGDEEYVVAAADGASTTQVWIGIAASEDTVTASADGEVYVYDNPEYIYRGKPTTPANLAPSIINSKVTLDVDGNGRQTVDETDTTNGVLTIKGFDATAGEETIDIQVSASATLAN